MHVIRREMLTATREFFLSADDGGTSAIHEYGNGVRRLRRSVNALHFPTHEIIYYITLTWHRLTQYEVHITCYP
jgi:hypothetical protein